MTPEESVIAAAKHWHRTRSDYVTGRGKLTWAAIAEAEGRLARAVLDLDKVSGQA